MKNKKSLWVLSALICSLHVQADNQRKGHNAPVASKSEARIVHWQGPAEEYSFLDLPELVQPFIDTTPAKLRDDIPVKSVVSAGANEALLISLAEDIAAGKYGKYDSLLIAHKGNLVFESYFRRGRVNLPHPQSSATKSYTSMILGRAIQMGYLSMDDLKRPVTDFLTELDGSTFVKGAGNITLHEALTMTSGLNISEEDWKIINEDPVRAKGQAEVQLMFELSEPIGTSDKVFKYGTGPQLVMQVVNAVVPGPVKNFIDNELLGKLGITNFDWQTANSGLPESGWEVSLTSRDMLKLGLIVGSGGIWQGQQLISEDYLARATSQLVLPAAEATYGGGENVRNFGYGYLWWSADYIHNGETFRAASAQGGGGIYIVVIDALDLVIVVSAHHREDTTQQLIAERILPTFTSTRTTEQSPPSLSLQ